MVTRNLQPWFNQRRASSTNPRWLIGFWARGSFYLDFAFVICVLPIFLARLNKFSKIHHPAYG
jgi:hypothetical protein